MQWIRLPINQLNRSTFNVLRVIRRVLTDKTHIQDLFANDETIEVPDYIWSNNISEHLEQLQIEFNY